MQAKSSFQHSKSRLHLMYTSVVYLLKCEHCGLSLCVLLQFLRKSYGMLLAGIFGLASV